MITCPTCNRCDVIAWLKARSEFPEDHEKNGTVIVHQYLWCGRCEVAFEVQDFYRIIPGFTGTDALPAQSKPHSLKPVVLNPKDQQTPSMAKGD